MFQFFTSVHMDIFYTGILSKVFCYLPDVASGVIVLSRIISLVPTICVVGKDDEPNKVEFVLIDFHENSLRHCTDMLWQRILSHVFYHIYL